MESETSDSKKIFKVFEASKRKKNRSRKEEVDDTNSLGSEESKSLIHQAMSAKASLQNIQAAEQLAPGGQTPKRESSPSVAESPVRVGHRAHRSPRSPRRHRRLQREELSLALNAGLIASPRSGSPQKEGDGLNESIPVDSSSLIYAFLEEAIKKDKRKHRGHRDHMHNRDRTQDYDSRERRDNDRERKEDRERVHAKEREVARHKERHREREFDDESTIREHHRHHRRRRHDPPSREYEVEQSLVGCVVDGEHHRHHRRRRHDPHYREYDVEQPVKERSQLPGIDQTVLFETFAKLCSTITEKSSNPVRPDIELIRNQSHKSLQCEVLSKNASCDVDQRPERLRSREPSHETVHRSYTRVRSLEDVHSHTPAHDSRARLRSPACDSRGRLRSPARDSRVLLRSPARAHQSRDDNCARDNVHNSQSTYKQPPSKYASKIDVVVSRTKALDDERYREYPALPTRSCVQHARVLHDAAPRDTRHRLFEEDRRLCCEQKTSRSFDPHHETREEDRLRRSTRSDTQKKRYDDDRARYDEGRRYDDGKHYDDARRYNDVKRYDDGRRYEDVRRCDDGRPYEDCRRYDDTKSRYDDRRDRFYEDRVRDLRECPPYTAASRERRWRRALDRCERGSVASRDDDYRERDSERERESVPSVVDEGGASTHSGKSSYMKVVKQGIAEQREAMDKMMKLWKELMRCFKTISQNPAQDKAAAQDSAASVQESAAAQLRLWRECMRRYETVARDVGDTDARLMDEIAKQRGEMAEMANMWQECLQRYRDITNDFNSLKQQLKTESPPMAACRPPPAPLACAEGEGTLPPAPYCLPPAFPPPQPPAMAGMGAGMGTGMGAGMGAGGYAGSPLRQRASAPPASAPPAWWWMHEQAAPRRASPPAGRRRSSPDSRRSVSHSPGRDRRHRRKERDREDTRFKEKSSKPSGARSDHRHRKR